MITLDVNEYKTILSNRTDISHKGTFGRAGLICGSTYYQGAAYYTNLAALRTGVGIVVSFIPDTIYNTFTSKINASILEPLTSREGFIYDSQLTNKVLARKCSAILCGSGLGIAKGSMSATLGMVQLEVPAVFDGDAFSHLSEYQYLLRRDAPTILTPHMGEFSRLTDVSVEELSEQKETIVSQFSKHYNCVVVLKDSTTLISDENGEVYSFSKPTSALSKGGSGDVLAGMTVSFLAQGYSTLDSAKAAVTLHNTCGHACSEKYGVFYTQPDDLIEAIPSLLY